MREDIYKFVRKKRRSSLLKENEQCEEIVVKGINKKLINKLDNKKLINKLDNKKLINKLDNKNDNGKDKKCESKRVKKGDNKQIEGDIELIRTRDNELIRKEDNKRIEGDNGKDKKCIEKLRNNENVHEKVTGNNFSLRDQVLSFVPISSSSISFSPSHCLLPKKYLLLTKIFKVMTTIQKYNDNRGLSNIFVKCKKCIEDVLKIRLNIEDIERIKFLIPEDLIIKNIEIDNEKTFTYFIKCTPEYFNNKIWEFYKQQNPSNKFVEDVEDIPILNVIETKNTKSNDLNISKGTDKDKQLSINVNKKSKTILERIKEKERLRREKFISDAKEEDNSLFLKKIDLYLKKDNKKCVKIKEIVKVFNLYDGIRYVKKVIEKEKNYEIKEIFNEEYLIKLI